MPSKNAMNLFPIKKAEKLPKKDEIQNYSKVTKDNIIGKALEKVGNELKYILECQKKKIYTEFKKPNETNVDSIARIYGHIKKYGIRLISGSYNFITNIKVDFTPSHITLSMIENNVAHYNKWYQKLEFYEQNLNENEAKLRTFYFKYTDTNGRIRLTRVEKDSTKAISEINKIEQEIKTKTPKTKKIDESEGKYKIGSTYLYENTVDGYKFWKFTIENKKKVVVQYGRIESAGRESIRNTKNFEETKKFVNKKVNEKLTKGYVFIQEDSPKPMKVPTKTEVKTSIKAVPTKTKVKPTKTRAKSTKLNVSTTTITKPLKRLTDDLLTLKSKGYKSIDFTKVKIYKVKFKGNKYHILLDHTYNMNYHLDIRLITQKISYIDNKKAYDNIIDYIKKKTQIQIDRNNLDGDYQSNLISFHFKEKKDYKYNIRINPAIFEVKNYIAKGFRKGNFYALVNRNNEMLSFGRAEKPFKFFENGYLSDKRSWLKIDEKTFLKFIEKKDIIFIDNLKDIGIKTRKKVEKLFTQLNTAISNKDPKKSDEIFDQIFPKYLNSPENLIFPSSYNYEMTNKFNDLKLSIIKLQNRANEANFPFLKDLKVNDNLSIGNEIITVKKIMSSPNMTFNIDFTNGYNIHQYSDQSDKDIVILRTGRTIEQLIPSQITKLPTKKKKPSKKQKEEISLVIGQWVHKFGDPVSEGKMSKDRGKVELNLFLDKRLNSFKYPDYIVSESNARFDQFIFSPEEQKENARKIDKIFGQKQTIVKGNYPQVPATWESNTAILAMKYRDFKGKINVNGWWFSEKLDGYRALWDGKNLWTNPRKKKSNKIIEAPDFFLKGLPPFAIDGELWIGLNTFSSMGIARMKKRDSSDKKYSKYINGWKNIKYMVYDSMDNPRDPFSKRYNKVKAWFEKHPCKHVIVVKQFVRKNEEHLMKQYDEVIEKGGEGLMLRDPNAPYIPKRTKFILKVKPSYDEEGFVIGYIEGKGMIKGMVGSIELVNEEGIHLSVGSGLSFKQRLNPPKLGSIITYTYFAKFPSGAPREPRFHRERTDGYVWKGKNTPKILKKTYPYLK